MAETERPTGAAGDAPFEMMQSIVWCLGRGGHRGIIDITAACDVSFIFPLQQTIVPVPMWEEVVFGG